MTTESLESTKLRVALCQFHVTEDKETNLKTCAHYLDQAAAAKANLVVLPEIWNSPYATAAFAEYAEVLPDVAATSCPESVSAEMVRSKAVQHKLWIVGGSIPERDNGKLYNTCLVYSPTGTVVAKHRKVHLFDIDVPGGITFFESDTLSPGSTVSSFETPWCSIGVGICYDIRFPEYAMLLARNCKVLIFPGAFNLTTGPAHWELLQRGRAVDNQCYVLTASPARSAAPEKPGKYPHYTAWGHSTAVAPFGDIVATTDETAGIVIADLDLTKVDEMRRSIPVRLQKRADLYKLEAV
jgi:omega-amidase